MHLLIILALLVWTLVGLWVLRRMWAISAAERRERRELRREARRAHELERREREERLREQTTAHRAAERERRAALRVTKPIAGVAPLGLPFAATIGLLMWGNGARVEMIVYALVAVAVGVMALLCLQAITHAHAESVLREAAQRRLAVR